MSIPTQTIILQTTANFYFSSRCRGQDIQGDTKSHHPIRNGMLRDPARNRVKESLDNVGTITRNKNISFTFSKNATDPL